MVKNNVFEYYNYYIFIFSCDLRDPKHGRFYSAGMVFNGVHTNLFRLYSTQKCVIISIESTLVACSQLWFKI